MNTGRKFIGIEREETYFDIAEKRIFDVSSWNEEAATNLVGFTMSSGRLSTAA
jgi:DNA modification methylase